MNPSKPAMKIGPQVLERIGLFFMLNGEPWFMSAANHSGEVETKKERAGINATSEPVIHSGTLSDITVSAMRSLTK